MADDITPYLPAAGEVTVFSAEWCGHCTRLKGQLARAGVGYREVQIEQDPAAERIAAHVNGGDWLIPTVVFPDGQALVNPSLAVVQATLASVPPASASRSGATLACQASTTSRSG
ncbi:glutaredoxin domain-containing protein [Microbacterium ulmi]|uniref:NrdH-redoxin n=1 Tax=Microbacterium ulmi TaxID=179095 RepID=A0A7Y2LWU1_9MICO|nr:mycoredoxin [Microbacterium ulmi]NNH02294.1 NrdH-redoxin [Microbacterium ulmi]